MSVSTLAHPPEHRTALTKFWLALAVLVAAGVAIAWLGAGSMRSDTTESGLQFRTIEAGSGPYIQDVDGVMIEYEGRLLDGTVFDSSAGRGPQPMIAGQTIPGFAEALSMMQEGGSYRVLIPSELAYGAEPPPGSVPPNSDLEFDVRIVEVVPNAALMTGAPPQPGELPPQAGELPPEAGQAPPQGQ